MLCESVAGFTWSSFRVVLGSITLIVLFFSRRVAITLQVVRLVNTDVDLEEALLVELDWRATQ